jgi:hypothetical protein
MATGAVASAKRASSDSSRRKLRRLVDWRERVRRFLEKKRIDPSSYERFAAAMGGAAGGQRKDGRPMASVNANRNTASNVP